MKYSTRTPILRRIGPIVMIFVITLAMHDTTSGQSIFFDYCNNTGWVEDNSYSAAANQGGLWNKGFTSSNHLDTGGNPTNISIVNPGAGFGPCRRESTAIGPVGNAARLLSDGRSIGAANPVGRKLKFTNLLPGKYTVYTYAWNGQRTSTAVTLNNQGKQVIGGRWSGQLIKGVTHAKHEVTIASGQEFEIHLVTEQGLGILNGIQLVHAPVGGNPPVTINPPVTGAGFLVRTSSLAGCPSTTIRVDNVSSATGWGSHFSLGPSENGFGGNNFECHLTPSNEELLALCYDGVLQSSFTPNRTNQFVVHLGDRGDIDFVEWHLGQGGVGLSVHRRSKSAFTTNRIPYIVNSYFPIHPDIGVCGEDNFNGNSTLYWKPDGNLGGHPGRTGSGYTMTVTTP